MEKYAILFLALFMPLFIIALMGGKGTEEEKVAEEKELKLVNYVPKDKRADKFLSRQPICLHQYLDLFVSVQKESDTHSWL